MVESQNLIKVTKLQRINIEDPNFTLDDLPTNWGGGVNRYNGELFEGIVFEYYPNTVQLYAESEYKEGVLNGRQVEYWSNGQLKLEYFKKYDFFYGHFREWDEQGVLISHQEFDNFGNRIRTII